MAAPSFSLRAASFQALMELGRRMGSYRYTGLVALRLVVTCAVRRGLLCIQHSTHLQPCFSVSPRQFTSCRD